MWASMARRLVRNRVALREGSRRPPGFVGCPLRAWAAEVRGAGVRDAVQVIPGTGTGPARCWQREAGQAGGVRRRWAGPRRWPLGRPH